MSKTRLKLLRVKLGLSQREMAEELGVPLRTYQNWEYGVRKISKVAVKNLMLKFKVNPDWLLNGEGDMFVQEEGNEAQELINELERIRRDYGEEHYKRAIKLVKKWLQDIQTFSESSVKKKKAN